VFEQAANTIADVYELFGWKGNDRVQAVKKLADRWEQLSVQSGVEWMAILKYKIAAFFSSRTEQPLPPCPFDESKDLAHVLLGGSAYKWQRLFFRDHKFCDLNKDDRCMQFLLTILQSKGGMPRASEQQLKAEADKTVEQLTSTKPSVPFKPVWAVPWGDQIADRSPNLEFYATEETAKAQLRRTVRELFTGEVMTLSDRVKTFFPSTSANYINNRAGAGAVGSILESGIMNDLQRPGGYLEISKITEEPEEENRGLGSGAFRVDSAELEFQFSKLWFRVLKLAQSEQPNVKAVPLAEPLKIRVISKGPPFLYTALRPIWKFIHNILRRKKTFRFIGTPDTEEGMLDALGRLLREDEVYVSGDYKGATNNLKSWASEVVAEELALCLGLSKVETELFLRGLTGHVFDTKDGMKKQTMGQLMGSIVSFPILCIINAAMCRWAIEITDQSERRLADCAMVINGDDVAMRGKRALYDHWKLLTSIVGLTESVGKTYVSKSFVIINSNCYRRVSEPIEVGVKKRPSFLQNVKYVNLGLVSGRKRSEADQKDDLGSKVSLFDSRLGSVGSRANDLFESTPPDLRDEVMEMFLTKNKDALLSSGLPWFIPEWLGGLGLPEFGGFENSEADLRIARSILMNWNTRKPRSMAAEPTPWEIRELASKILPVGEVQATRTQAVESLEQLSALSCVNLLFDSQYQLADIFNKDFGEKDGRCSAMNHNRRLWEPNAKNMHYAPLEPALLKSLQRFQGAEIYFGTQSARRSQLGPRPRSIKELSQIPNDLD
jgi:hypothetical protein